MSDSDLVRRFRHSIIMVAANTVEQLRPCDTYRVVQEAHDQELMQPFVAWLRAERPDLDARISEAVGFVMEDETA